jgi:hypothetical protein
VRYLSKRRVTIDDAVFVAGCLAALGGPNHEHALAALRAIASAMRVTSEGHGMERPSVAPSSCGDPRGTAAAPVRVPPLDPPGV